MESRTTLRLAEGEGLLREVERVALPDLDAQPFRPGELPRMLQLELDAETTGRVERSSAAAGIPAELWLRLAVEGSRHVAVAANAGTADLDELVEALDRDATVAPTVAPLDGRLHRAYASKLRTAVARRPTASRGRFTLRLPDQVVTAWAFEAAVSGQTLADYAAERIASAPPHVVEWEAAAADSGAQLGEWIYLRALLRRR